MKHRFWTTLILSALCVLSQSAFAQSTFRVTRIVDDPVTPSNSIFVTDLNNRGELVALVTSNDGAIVRAVLWRDGVITEIGDLQGGTSTFTGASAINDRGDVVGISESDGAPLPYIYSNGQIRQLKLFSSPGGVFPNDINNFRQIMGGANLETDEPGNNDIFQFLQTGSRTTRLHPLPGFDFATAMQVNELGVVVGQCFTGNDVRAVIWIGSRAFNLGVLPGGSDSSGTGINDFGDVIGTSLVANQRRPFLWRRGRMTELMGLSAEEGVQIFVSAINNRRQIVGGQLSGFLQLPLLWERDGKVYSLNELISVDDPLKPFINLTVASLINNRGQIIALGRDSRSPEFLQSYLLTPIP